LAPAAGATSSPSAVEVPLDEHGVKCHEHADEVDQTKRARFADDAFSILEAGFLLDDSAVGEHAPKTPRLDDTTYKQKPMLGMMMKIWVMMQPSNNSCTPSASMSPI
jgi:hypothetical protein